MANSHFSEIFCQGNLLDAAQSAYIYNDSKSFVDMKLKNEPGKCIVYNHYYLLVTLQMFVQFKFM